ncbi:MAG: hypothetical protein ACR2QW_20515 [bacterium]
MVEIRGREKLSHLKSAMEDGLVKQLFDRLRNYLICATLFAIGIFEYKQKPGDFLGFDAGDYSGLPIILLAFVLFVLNTFDGIRMSIKHLENVILRIVLIVFYVFFSIRLMELAWKYSTTTLP